MLLGSLSFYRVLNKTFILLLISVFFISKVASAQPTGTSVNAKTKELFQAIRSGSSAELEKQLTAGASANDSLNGYSALMAAAISGSVEQMKLLIDYGANVNYIAKDSTTALWIAIPDWDKTNLLLNHGADLQHTIGGYTVLVKLASLPGTVRLFRLLMDKGLDAKKSAPDNMLLYTAAMSGDTAILGLLIRQGLNVNDSISFGDHPIVGAIWFRTFQTLKMLVDNGADPNILLSGSTLNTYFGSTPLMIAGLNNDKPSFFYLLEHGANPNVKNYKGYTALMLLQQSEKDDPEMTMALLKHGADPEIKTPAGNDALYFAMQKGNSGSVELLKKYSTNR